MKQGLSEDTWRQLRQEARRASDRNLAATERWVEDAMRDGGLERPAQLEKRLERLSEIWPVHNKPLSTRIPFPRSLLRWLSARLLRFLLQHQIGFNAEVTRTLHELYLVQKQLTQEQVARSDDLFRRLDEKVLALEARVRDLEEEVERLR